MCALKGSRMHSTVLRCAALKGLSCTVVRRVGGGGLSRRLSSQTNRAVGRLSDQEGAVDESLGFEAAAGGGK